MMQTIDGRSSFYQWDVNQKLTAIDLVVGEEVQFVDYREDLTLIVVAYKYDGEVVVDVPNVLLQQTMPIVVYRCKTLGDGEHTWYTQSFVVKPRPKPSDYVYTEIEIKRWEDLEDRVTTALVEVNKALTSFDTDLTEVENKVGEIEDDLTDVNKKVTSHTSQLNNKLDKAGADTYTRVYAVDNKGNQKLETIRVAATANAIVQRGTDGSITVPKNPSSAAHATSKEYVDNAIEELRSTISNLSLRVAYLEEGGTDYGDGGIYT